MVIPPTSPLVYFAGGDRDDERGEADECAVPEVDRRDVEDCAKRAEEDE